MDMADKNDMASSVHIFEDFITLNSHLKTFQDMLSKPITDLSVLYNDYYSTLDKIFDMSKLHMYLLDFNPEKSLYEIVFKSNVNGLDESALLREDTLAQAISNSINSDESIYLLDRASLPYAVKNSPFIDRLPLKVMAIHLVLDNVNHGTMLIYTYDDCDNQLFRLESLSFFAFISNGLALAVQRKGYEERINFLVYNDYLTQTPTRTHFCELLVAAMQKADLSNTMLGVLMIGIDKIKHINDTLGYYIGDAIIVGTAKRIISVLGEQCPVSRFGGDTFTSFLPNVCNLNQVDSVVRKILDVMKEPIKVEDYILSVSVSIGISIFPDDGESVDIVLKNADAAMNESKRDGKSLFKYYQTRMTDETRRQLFLNNQLLHAIARDEFELYYQAQLDIASNKIIGTEALIRWKHPERGLLPPFEFIPFSEENGLIVSIDKLVLKKACIQAKKWYDEGKNLIMSVNISAEHFKHGNIVNSIINVLEETQLPPSLLEIEILESVMLDDFTATIEIIKKLKKIGIWVSLDDFGSGYSSLGYITLLPIDVIKIDYTFTMKLEENPRNRVIIKTIISMANEMQFKVVAEGVEKQSHLEFLRSQHCDIAQGYFINKPLPIADVENVIAKYND